MTHAAKVTFFSGLIVLIGAISAFTFVRLQIIWAGDELEARAQRDANLLAQQQTLRELERLVADSEAERTALTTHVLSESDTISFLAEIEAIGRAQGVMLTTNQLNVVDQEDGKQRLVVTYAVNGPVASVQRMLRIFETVPYDSELQDLSLQRSVGAQLQITMSLSLYSHETVQ